MAANGVYASLAHTEEVIRKYENACDIVFGKIKAIMDAGKDIETELYGPVCHAGFARLN